MIRSGPERGASRFLFRPTRRHRHAFLCPVVFDPGAAVTCRFVEHVLSLSAPQTKPNQLHRTRVFPRRDKSLPQTLWLRGRNNSSTTMRGHVTGQVFLACTRAMIVNHCHVQRSVAGEKVCVQQPEKHACTTRHSLHQRARADGLKKGQCTNLRDCESRFLY